MDEPGLVFDKPEYEEDEKVPDEKIMYHIERPRFIAVLIINVAVFVLILVLLWTILGEISLFSERTGFPSPTEIFIFSLISALLMTYVVYFLMLRLKESARAIFWVFIFYNLFLLAWTVDLSIYADEVINSIPTREKVGSYLSIITLVLALILFYYAWSYRIQTGVAMLLVVAWIMYLLYNAWFTG